LSDIPRHFTGKPKPEVPFTREPPFIFFYFLIKFCSYSKKSEFAFHKNKKRRKKAKISTFFGKAVDKSFHLWYNSSVIQRQQVPVKAMLSCRGMN